jgi:hypothetical protein
MTTLQARRIDCFCLMIGGVTMLTAVAAAWAGPRLPMAFSAPAQSTPALSDAGVCPMPEMRRLPGPMWWVSFTMEQLQRHRAQVTPAPPAAPSATPSPQPERIVVVPTVKSPHPTHRPILRVVRDQDGRVIRTVITSEPLPTTLEDAWGLLARDELDLASEVFGGLIEEDDRAAEASLGLGLVRAATGDVQAGAAAVRQAMELEPDVLDRVVLTVPVREALRELRRGLPQRVPSAGSDLALLVSTVEQLLGPSVDSASLF